MPRDTEEGRLLYGATTKMEEARLSVEEAVLRLGRIAEDADENMRERLNNTRQNLRRAITKYAEVSSSLRMASELGFGPANQVFSNIAGYEGLSEDQRTMLKKLQKEAMDAKKEAAKAKPYQVPVRNPEFKTISQCHVCGVSGHWAKDGRCKPADIQAKALRDASKVFLFVRSRFCFPFYFSLLVLNLHLIITTSYIIL